MSDTIKLGLEDCPNQQFFLLGYSQGATVVLETLDKIDDRSSAAIAGVVLVGNPYRKPGRLSNVDEMNRHDNRTAFGTFAAQAMKTNDSIPAYSKELDQSGRVKDICLEVRKTREFFTVQTLTYNRMIPYVPAIPNADVTLKTAR